MLTKDLITGICLLCIILVTSCSNKDNPISIPNDEDLGTVVTNNSADNIIQIEISGGVDYYTKEMVKANDNSYILLGERDNEPYLVKVSNTGEMFWEKIINIEDGSLKILKLTSDGNLIVAGTSKIFDTNDFFLIKMNMSGNILWERNFNNGGEEYCNDMIVVPGGYVLCGYTDKENEREKQYIIKVDPSGNLVWEKEYGSWRQVRAKSIIRTSNDRLIVVGQTDESSSGRDVHVVKLFENGDIINEKLIFNNAPNKFIPEVVVEDLYGNFIILGTNLNHFSQFSPAALNIVKFNNQFDIIADRVYEDVPILVPRDVVVNLDNSTSIVGDGFPYYYYGVDGHIIATINTNGQLISTYADSRFRYMSTNTIIETNNGYALAGYFIGSGIMIVIESSFDI